MGHPIDGIGNERINLYDVTTLRPRSSEGDGWTSFECFDAEGQRLGAISRDTLHTLTAHPRPMIPNTSGLVLLRFWEDDIAVEFERCVVLAWRGGSERPTPVICDEEFDAEKEVYCYETRDRVFLFPGDRFVTTLDEARAYAREELRRRKVEKGR